MKITKRQIFMAIFAVVVVLLGREIYYYQKFYDKAWDVPAFQTQGPPDAPITILEFTDYNCPYCRAMHPIVKEVLKDRDDILYISRPIGALGEESEQLVRLVLAAGLQGKFWEMHDALLSHDSKFGDIFIRTAAIRNSINPDQMYADANGEDVQNYLNSNKVSAAVLGIRYTPTLMINKTIYVPKDGKPTVSDLTRAIANAS